MNKHIFFYGGILAVLGVGFLFGWYGRITYTNAQPSRLTEIRQNSSEYSYINPLILVDSPRQAPEYEPLKNIITKYIAVAETKGDVSSVSVYFRDLNSGKWTGVNENDIYDPSSMLKVAVMIGYLNAISSDPGLLSKELSYTNVGDVGQYYKPEHPLQTGQYSVRDLIQSMIIDSDNNALNSLYANDRNSFVGVLKTLQIPPPAATSTLDFMSPKMYASIFRTLYSSTYLSREASEQALQLLTLTTFKDGLVAGVPSGTVVAHKFGEHTYTEISQQSGQTIPTSRQLHDCGIIYAPQKPYLLCVMTQGDDFSKLSGTISGVSKAVWEQITAK